MALLTKSDLIKTYTWTVSNGDDPKISGEPDSTLLSRKEGYEVIYMINKLAEQWKLKQKTSGLKIERMIHAAPSELRSQANVKKWIYDNWKNFT